MELYNSSLTLRHSEACTTDVLTDQVSLFQLLTGDPVSVELSDQTVVVHNFSASSVPVFNATTNQTSERGMEGLRGAWRGMTGLGGAWRGMEERAVMHRMYMRALVCNKAGARDPWHGVYTCCLSSRPWRPMQPCLPRPCARSRHDDGACRQP